MEKLTAISRPLSAGILSQSLLPSLERPMSSRSWSSTSMVKTPTTPSPAFLTRKAPPFFTTWRNCSAKRSGITSSLMYIFPSTRYLKFGLSDLARCPILVFHILCSQIPRLRRVQAESHRFLLLRPYRRLGSQIPRLGRLVLCPWLPTQTRLRHIPRRRLLCACCEMGIAILRREC